MIRMDQDKLSRCTTLVQRGLSAITFADMATFAKKVETRPLDKLLEDLPGLADLSEAKFALAMLVLRRRFHDEPAVNRRQLQVFAGEIALEVEDETSREQVRHVFDDLQTY